MGTKFTLLLAILLFATSMVGTSFAGKIIYVDADATGGNNGSSWADAYIYLQDALAAAQSSDQIRAAAGTYKPDCGAGITPGDRTATFQLKNGVTIKGGYAGFGEPDPNARNIEVYKTILSGDLSGNDSPDFANNGENSYHIVTAGNVSPTAILDGFTITGGNANGNNSDNNGGGMFNSWSRTSITDCIFTGNSAASVGGGVYNDNSIPTLTNCTFSGNSAIVGGGVHNSYSTPIITNCTFRKNKATGYYCGGGAMSNYSSASRMTNCAFTENSASDYGGGMYNSSSNPTVTDCTFSGNSAYDGGGIYNDRGSPTLANCTFSGNSAGDGGGMHNSNSSPTLTNCTFNGNSAYDGGGIYNNGGSPTLANCTFIDNSAKSGGGMDNARSSPKLIDCTFIKNWSVTSGGGMDNYYSSPIVTNCVFTGNYAANGGGVFDGGNSSSTLTNCAFIGNVAVTSGGGIYNSGSSAGVTNCTFGGNDAYEGSGIYNSSGSATTVANCILRDHGGEIWTNNVSDVNITYSDVKGGWAGEGNLNADPCFVDPDGPDGIPGTEDDNLRLSAGSLCIDAGDNTAVPAGITTDLDGNPRFVDDPNTLDKGKGTPPIVDMGAYEYGGGESPIGVCGDSGHPYPKGDLNQDCRVNFADFAEFADNWLVCNAPKCD